MLLSGVMMLTITAHSIGVAWMETKHWLSV